MEIRFLNRRQGSRKLRIAFLGFSFHTDLVLQLYPELLNSKLVHRSKDFDVAMVDFSSSIRHLSKPGEAEKISTSVNEIFDDYDEVCVYAHSFGVYAAGLFFSPKLNFCSTETKNKIHTAFAYSGTLNPINDEQGIPLRVFSLTRRDFNDRTLQNFRQRCGVEMPFCDDTSECRQCGNKKDIQMFAEDLELAEQVYLHHGNPGFRYDYALVAMNDKIFPPRNQVAAWQTCAETILQNCNHFEALSLMLGNLTSQNLHTLQNE